MSSDKKQDVTAEEVERYIKQKEAADEIERYLEAKKQEDAAELEEHIRATVVRMRAFGIKRCCQCNIVLHPEHYTLRTGPAFGGTSSYYCNPCGRK